MLSAADVVKSASRETSRVGQRHHEQVQNSSAGPPCPALTTAQLPANSALPSTAHAAQWLSALPPGCVVTLSAPAPTCVRRQHLASHLLALLELLQALGAAQVGCVQHRHQRTAWQVGKGGGCCLGWSCPYRTGAHHATCIYGHEQTCAAWRGHVTLKQHPMLVPPPLWVHRRWPSHLTEWME